MGTWQKKKKKEDNSAWIQIICHGQPSHSLYFVDIIDENFPCSLSSFNCIKRINNICFSSTTFWSSPPICSSYDLLASATCLSEFMLTWHLYWALKDFIRVLLTFSTMNEYSWSTGALSIWSNIGDSSTRSKQKSSSFCILFCNSAAT